jgi:intermediate filament protein if
VRNRSCSSVRKPQSPALKFHRLHRSVSFDPSQFAVQILTSATTAATTTTTAARRQLPSPSSAAAAAAAAAEDTVTMATTTQQTSVTKTMDGPSVITKTTTYETRSASSYVADASGPSYRSTIAPRNIIIQRTTNLGGGGGSGGSMMSRSVERSSNYGALGAGAPSGAYANVTTTGVTAVKSSREREKKDMQDLNERFASYIEKVRFLEAQNRRLADELEKLKAKWGKETTQIKAMYQAELDEARKCLDDSDREKARLEIRVASLEEQLEELRNKLQQANAAVLEERERSQRNNQQLSDYEAEINLLRRRVEQLESDRDKDKKTIVTLQDALNRTRVDLDNETLLHVDAENRRQTLEEELEFLKQVHEQELKELAALAYRDTTAENREYWKNEMGQALREIHQVYDDKMEGMRGELETFYNLKIQEFRTGATKQNMESQHSKEENKKLRTTMTDLRDKLNDLDAKNAALQRELEALRREKEDRERELESENNEFKMEIVKLRAEMEAILRELQSIMDSKLGLELEIAAYRKLLEGEESRIGLRSLVDQFSTSAETAITQQQAFSSYSAAGGSSSAGGGGFGGAGGSGGAMSSGMGGGMMSSNMSGGLDSSMRMSQVVKGEMSAKTTYQRSAKGPVSIAECSADGKYITLENTGRKEESLDGWKIVRNIDAVDRPEFVLQQIVIEPMMKIKIWARGGKPSNAPPTDLECWENSWGTGSSVITKLVNPAGEDRATHVQKTVYS